MTDPYWAEVEAIFADVSALPPEARGAALRDRCAGRADVLAEVESLLHADAQAEAQRPSASFDLGAGDVVGAFRLLEPIGHGGMGRVFVGERVAGGFSQRAAVKLIDARGREALRRFESERQILAGLSHPHVVSLLDGGITDRGQPYLVMELVEGTPLDAYCATTTPTLEARLRLCARVASAVQYAHSRGVVHRDLKPANILVTADGAPKVLDFGVAKLTDAGDAGPGLTAPGVPAALTMNYASPEQVRGLPVSPASDIYSLGVVCHEVLIGARPYDLEGRPIDEAIRMIQRAAPARAGRQGRVEEVIAIAMALSPGDRYASAGELQAALERCATAVAAGASAHVASSPWRRRAVPALVAVAVVIGVAAAAYVWRPSQNPSAAAPPQGVVEAPSPVVSPAPSAPAEAAPLQARAQLVPPPASPASGRAQVPPRPDSAENAGIVADLAAISTADLEIRAREKTDAAMAVFQTSQRQALVLIEDVVAVRRELVHRLPEQPIQRARLGWALSFLAQRKIAFREWPAARAAAEEAVALAEPMAGRGGSFESDLAYNLYVLGAVEREAGNAPVACDTFGRSERHHENTRAGLNDRYRGRFQFLEAELPKVLAACR